MNLAFLNIGTQEMMVIVLVALLLFGGKKLPELARGLGRGIREFKDASEGIKREISDQINNFEKEVDTVKADIEKEPEPTNTVAEVQTELDQPLATTEEGENPEKPEKKTPQFTAPAGTYEHKPYTTPTADDYYSYGYNDNFATTAAPADSNTTPDDFPKDEPASEIENPEKENPTRQA